MKKDSKLTMDEQQQLKSELEQYSDLCVFHLGEDTNAGPSNSTASENGEFYQLSIYKMNSMKLVVPLHLIVLVNSHQR